MLPPAVGRPGRICCQEESRFGLFPMHRRRLTVTGVKPLGTGPYRVENFSVYGAVEPTTGESCFLERPYRNATNCQIVLNELSRCDQETLHLVLWDKGRGHQAQALAIPDHEVCLFLPPDSPELNPIARLWHEVTEPLAWVLAAAIEELEHRVAMILTPYSKAAIRSLTSYPYVVRAVNAVCS